MSSLAGYLLCTKLQSINQGITVIHYPLDEFEDIGLRWDAILPMNPSRGTALPLVLSVMKIHTNIKYITKPYLKQELTER